MAELTMLGRCPTCGRERLIAPICRCGHYEWTHALDPHRRNPGKCYHGDAAGPCDCREYVEAVADG